MPKISVVMPYYNNEKYLKGALESYLVQSEPDIEIIVVNDGSADSSKEIIDSCNDPRLVRVNLPQNRGISGAYNAGLERVTADYICFAGADDIAAPNRIEKILEAFSSEPGVAIVVSDVDIIDADGNETGKRYGFPDYITGKNVLIETFKRNYFLGAAMAIKNQGDILLDPAIPAGDDFDLAIRILLAGGKWARIPDPLVKYRIHGGNFSSAYSKMRQGALHVYQKYSSSYLEKKFAEFGYTRDEIDIALGIIHLFKDNVGEALPYLKKALTENSGSEGLRFENHFYLAVALYLTGDFQAAYNHFQYALEIFPNEATILNNTGVMAAIMEKNIDYANQLIKKALSFQPSYLDGQHNLKVLSENKPDLLKITRRILPGTILHGSGYIN